ncbi:hypothetical protein GobsT_15380 [Gemmata obscuriglobus]|uniref:Type II secretion system protein E n=1 Tax=Gemmata obscuriglobus TaxID=114 RepID=A0A2Z3GZV5_9BACT|nr:type II secretion system protein E [Gemmata obscuriglobus]AWM40049.1 hypothetical protein C1280_25615 [Gemmata obscuriglobus]QEG26791.1 hypothetical protein GobsT_15380 [Gemmata obscuriglobus]VTS02663.1 Type II secretion system protein E OS=Pirellula staleyi (strain ATCC 27377 / DSM 6068 / ICPB 4128) GN=Psta_1434 PE=4 SV=1 [Gemmata obscuriglobus UQM 2246]
MLPQRPSASTYLSAGQAGPIGFTPVHFEAARKRVLTRLEERLDMGSSKRMPQSLLRQSLKQYAEQVVDQEARGFAKPDRDRLLEEVYRELFGYGPLEELFNDPGAREVMVVGPGMVIVRRDAAQWLPTSVKFRDEGHLRGTLDRIAAQAEPVGPVLASMSLFDVRLPNGFRALALIPPEVLGQPATVSFIREAAAPAPAAPPKDATATQPGLPATGSASPAAKAPAPVSTPALPRPGSITASPRPGSGLIAAPAPRPPGDPSPTMLDPLLRHRARILERLFAKFAALKVYDLSRLDVTELRKIIAAYIREYTETEKIYLSDADQGRLMLEILTSLQR